MRTTSTASIVLRAGLAAFAYWGAVMLSYHFGGGFEKEANVWIASGVAIGVLTLADPARWPIYGAALMLGALTANFVSGASWLESLVYALEEVLVAAVIAWLLRRLIGPLPRLDEARKVLLFVAVGALGSALLGLAAGILAYAVLGLANPLPEWRLWIISSGVGTLIVAPLMFAWADFRAKRSGGATTADFVLGASLFVLLIGTTLLVFKGVTAQRFSGSVGYALTYLPLPFLVLGSLVWGARGATLSTFVLAAIAVLYTVRGEGPFAGIEGFLGEDVLEVQGYVATAALLTLLLTALSASRDRARNAAAEWKLRYEAVIAASDQLLYELDPVSGRVLWAGDTGRLLGAAPASLATLAAYLERVHPDDRERLRGAFQALQSGGEKMRTTAHRYISASGEEQQFDGEANVIIDFDDSVHRIVGFLRPVRTAANLAGPGMAR